MDSGYALVVASFVDLVSTTVAVIGIDIEDIAGMGMMNEREDIAEGTVGRATLAAFLTLVHHYMCNFSAVVYVWGPLASCTCQMHYKAKEESRAKAMSGTSKFDSSPLDLEIPLARVRCPAVLDHSPCSDRNL